MSAEEKYKEYWSKKTKAQIEKEIHSWWRYFERHEAAYNLHGGNMTAPGQLADGDKISILKDILNDRTEN